MARTKISHVDPKDADPLPPREPGGLANQAYRAILQGLFDRTIPAGAELSQSLLMKLLGVTVQPLRDALRTMEAEGLVTIHSRSCIRFVKADLELSRSTYQFRTLLERSGARALAEKGDAAEIDQMLADHRALIVDLEEHGLHEAQEARLTEMEERLHGALISALRNPLIEITARRLKNYVMLVRLDRLVTTPLALRTLREHLDILEACARRDADAAEAALGTHFRQALHRILGMD